MTLSTSAVAVCCCSDSRSSLSSRVFSMAMTAWSAKVSRRSNLPIGKRVRFSTANQDRARRFSLAQQGNHQCRSMAVANSHLPALGKLVAFEKVGDMNGSCFEHRTTGHPVVGEWLSLPEGSTERTGMRKRDHRIPVAAKNCRVQRLTETHSSPDNRVQDRLDVGRRAADRSKDSGRARLLLQSLTQLARARFEFLLQHIAGGLLSARTHLRSGRTKVATLCSALRAFARQGHLVGTVTGPLPRGGPPAKDAGRQP